MSTHTKRNTRSIVVVATKKITEANFMGRKTWTHAKPGDRGVVVGNGDHGDPIVRFERSGTAIEVTIGTDGDARLALP